MTISPAIFRPKEAQAYLCCGRAFFYKLIKDGLLIKGHRLSNTFVFWTKSELDEAIRLMIEEAES